MKIGLLGFSFDNPNKGCEALTYSFISLLHKMLKSDITIINFSYDLCLGDVPNHFPDIKFVPYYMRLNRLSRIVDLRKAFDDCDIIFDITYGDNFSDIYSTKFVIKTSICKIIAIQSKALFVLLPQTYGPFKNKFFIPIVRYILKKSNVVFSRDMLSTKCIKSISGIEAITVTDLALSLPYIEKKLSKIDGKRHVGINISGLLWNGGFTKNNQFGLSVDYRTYVRGCIERLLNEGYTVHIVPHVFEKDGNEDGDLFVSEIIKKEYPNVIINDIANNPFDVKNYIASLDIFVGARMHATIDAFSAGLPTIPFAYSRKFEGLYNALGYDYLVDGTKLSTDEAITKTIHYIKNSDLLKEKVNNAKIVIDTNMDHFLIELKKILQLF